MPSLLGVLAASLTVVRALPQVARLLRTRDGRAGVSFEASVVYTLLYLPWILHGLTTSQASVLVANAGGALAYTAVAVLVVRYGQQPVGLARIGIWVAVITAGYLVGGVPGATLATYLGPLAYGYPQIRDAVTSPTVDSLSPASLALAAVEVSTWAAYALLVGDQLLGGYMAIALAVQLATLGVWAVRRDPHAARDALGDPVLVEPDLA